MQEEIERIGFIILVWFSMFGNLLLQSFLYIYSKHNYNLQVTTIKTEYPTQRKHFANKTSTLTKPLFLFLIYSRNLQFYNSVILYSRRCDCKKVRPAGVALALAALAAR